MTDRPDLEPHFRAAWRMMGEIVGILHRFARLDTRVTFAWEDEAALFIAIYDPAHRYVLRRGFELQELAMTRVDPEHYANRLWFDFQSGQAEHFRVRHEGSDG